MLNIIKKEVKRSHGLAQFEQDSFSFIVPYYGFLKLNTLVMEGKIILHW